MALSPLHLGEVLLKEFMKPVGLTTYALASPCGLSRTRLASCQKESWR
jgi:plasmid maintenance system antidote protein VapI